MQPPLLSIEDGCIGILDVEKTPLAGPSPREYPPVEKAKEVFCTAMAEREERNKHSSKERKHRDHWRTRLEGGNRGMGGRARHTGTPPPHPAPGVKSKEDAAPNYERFLSYCTGKVVFPKLFFSFACVSTSTRQSAPVSSLSAKERKKENRELKGGRGGRLSAVRESRVFNQNSFSR